MYETCYSLSLDETALGWADVGRWFWAKRAAFSFIDDESMVFWRLKLLLLQMEMEMELAKLQQKKRKNHHIQSWQSVYEM